MLTVRPYSGPARCWRDIHDFCTFPPTHIIETQGDRYYVCARHLTAMELGEIKPQHEAKSFSLQIRIALGKEAPEALERFRAGEETIEETV